jgi:hypothetical protein
MIKYLPSMLMANSRTAPRSLFKASCFMRIAAGILSPPRDPEEEEMVARVVPPVKLFLLATPTVPNSPPAKSSAVEEPAKRPRDELIPGDILPEATPNLLVSTGGPTVFMELAVESAVDVEVLMVNCDLVVSSR